MKRVVLIVLFFLACLSIHGQGVKILPNSGGIKIATVKILPGSAGVTTSYANTGGSGDRQAIIAMAQGGAGVIGGAFPPVAWIDGNTSDQTDFWANQTLDGVNTYLQFDFAAGHSPIINEIKYYQETSTGQGTWKFQGSPDASTWTDLGTMFALGGTTTQTITAPSANTTGYRYYRLLGMSGSCNNGPFVFEIEFKIANY